MAKGAWIKKGDPNQSAGWFLAELRRKDLVKGVMAQKEMYPGQGAWHYLLKEPEDIENTKVFIPFMGSSGATAISKLTKDKPLKDPVAVVLRPCEVRGVVELTKYKQIQLDNLIIISFDCVGAYPRRVYLNNPVDLPEDEDKLRGSCRRCKRFTPHFGDITLTYLGVSEGIFAIPMTEKGEELLNALGLELEDVPEEREKKLAEMEEKRLAAREKEFKEFAEEYGGMEGQLKFFGKCINCKNCMENCPICFCKECFFKSPSLTWDSEVYMDMLENKGAVRMPEDPIFFQWGRLAHITPSCIGCGLCTEACPVDIKVGLIFAYVAENVQGAFDYEAGRSLDEAPILMEFRENELEDLAL